VYLSQPKEVDLQGKADRIPLPLKIGIGRKTKHRYMHAYTYYRRQTVRLLLAC
jgi:hypothetical protein